MIDHTSMWTREELMRLRDLVKEQDLDLPETVFIEDGHAFMTLSMKEAVHGPFREISKMLNHKDLTVQIIAKWRLEMGR